MQGWKKVMFQMHNLQVFFGAARFSEQYDTSFKQQQQQKRS